MEQPVPDLLNDPTNVASTYRPEEADPSWRERAQCKGMPTEWFFPDAGQQGLSRFVTENVCATCPVQTECLEFGKNEDHGVWGGESGKALRLLRSGRPRKNSFVKHGTPAGYNNHLHNGEDPCVFCSLAMSDYNHRQGQTV